LHNLLDALDHLYDEHEFAPRWAWMLLVATKQAMPGTPWFEMLAVAERDIRPIVWTSEDPVICGRAFVARSGVVG
jgi:hypothetical protein